MTVYRALNLLCGAKGKKGKKGELPLKVRGARVMLRTQTIPPHIPTEKLKNKRARNFYLLFPSQEEIERYDSENDLTYQNCSTKKLGTNFVTQQNCSTKKLGTKNLLEEEDSPFLNDSKIEPHTHTQETPPLFTDVIAADGGQKRVCVPQELSFQQYLDYARSQSSIHTPEAWAMKHYAARDADVLVREWLEKQTPEQIAEARSSTENKNLFFSEALQILRGIQVVRPETDILKEIDGMPLADDVRAHLIGKFSSAARGVNQ
jgi:hypothetical protein